MKGSGISKLVGLNVISSPDALNTDYPTNVQRQFESLKHCRVVFDEVGTPLHDVDDLKKVFSGLSDAL